MRHIAVMLVLVAGSCSSPQSIETRAVSKSTVTSAPTSSTSGGPASADTDLPCGEVFPVFAADLYENDPLNVDGTPGPGPDSTPVEPNQLVAHWLGEYGNYELRWPPTGGLSNDHDWAEQMAGLPAHRSDLKQNRLVVYIQLDRSGGPCSQMTAEIYGPRPDPLEDQIFELFAALRPRIELDDYLSAVTATVTRATGGAEREEGQCALPVTATIDEHGRVTEEVAFDVVTRFVADRASGHRAQQCLTISGWADYESADQTIWPALCLFECEDGAAFTPVAPPSLLAMGGSDGILVSVVVKVTGDDGFARRGSEELAVVAVTNDDGQVVALITDAKAGPESFVDRTAAELFVAQFLNSLRQGDYRAASGQLFNEGVSVEVEARLGDVWDTDLSVLLAEFCQRAWCGSGFEIIGSGEVAPFGRDVLVRFQTPSGEIEIPISVWAFEARLSIGSLPPDRDQ